MAYTLQIKQKAPAFRPVSVSVTNPIDCNAKWDGKDAHWMPAEVCDLV